MTLKKVTLVTIVGIALALLFFLANFPWDFISQRPKMILSLISNIFLYSSLLFFLIQLYIRDK
jgi:energy-coupling factor transporter transmembrane protein EcfT